VAGVVDIDGPPGLESVIGFEQQVCGGPVVEQFLGGTPQERPERYRDGSATGLLPIGIRQELLIGEKLSAAWIDSIRAFGSAAARAGDPVHATTLENSGHFDGLNPKAPAWQTVLASIRSIVEKPR
jgi:hypothetical protein